MKFIKIIYPDGAFEIQETTVTQAQWVEIMGVNFSETKGKNNPVERISWHEAQLYIAKLNISQKKHIYRLPIEKEWEFASGKSPKDILKSAWCCENSNYRTHPVKKKNPNEFGLYDMLGNVWEWCLDESHSGAARGIRGGDYNKWARYCVPTMRGCAEAGRRFTSVGFRMIRAPIDNPVLCCPIC